MRMLHRLNPGPGLADFWTEFKRPNRYRWPILAASALLTMSLLYLLSDHAMRLNLLAGAVLVLLAGLAVGAMIVANVRISVPALLVAAAISGTMIWQFAKFQVRVPPRPPEVEYITTFAADRTDAEIQASNLANQQKQERWRAEQARREEEARNAYRTLGRATGIDVDAMERRIAEQEARAAQQANRDGTAPNASPDGQVAPQPR